MTDQHIKQRIAYLIEHGGIADDPIQDLRRKIHILFFMTGTACLFGVIGLALLLQ